MQRFQLQLSPQLQSLEYRLLSLYTQMMVAPKTDVAALVAILNDAQPKTAEESYFYEMFHRFGVGRTVNLTTRTENQHYILWCFDGEAVMQFFHMDSAEKLSFNRDGATWSIDRPRSYVRRADKPAQRTDARPAVPTERVNGFTDEKPRYKPKQTYKQKQRIERESKGVSTQQPANGSRGKRNDRRDDNRPVKAIAKRDTSTGHEPRIPPLSHEEIAAINDTLDAK